MTKTITWGPERKHDGSPDCPANARDVPCMITDSRFGLIEAPLRGKHIAWQYVTAYRLPVAVTAPASDPVRYALVEALLRWQSHGCPDCPGDCGGANPSVMSCIMRQTSAALTLAKGEAK